MAAATEDPGKTERGSVVDADLAFKLATGVDPEDIDLLRGTPVCFLQKNFGSLLKLQNQICAGRQKTKDMYHRSLPVETLSTFLSHNWSQPGWKKWIVLMMQYNLKMALIASFFGSITGATLNMVGVCAVLPSQLEAVPDDEPYGSYVIGNTMFVIFFFFYADILEFTKQWRVSPKIFLDIVCINQVDKNKQERGIAMLGCFIKNSETMMALVTTQYFRKLWTVYEIACFLCTHPIDCLLLVISEKEQFAMVLSYWLLAYNVMYIGIRYTRFVHMVYGLESLTLNQEVTFLLIYRSVWMIPIFIWCYSRIPKMLALMANIEATIETFSVKHAKCFQESDRPFVEENIRAFMKATSQVASTATKEEALEKFDTLVRTDVLATMKKSFGTFGFSYWYAIMPGICVINRILDATTGKILTGKAHPILILVDDFSHYLINLCLCLGPFFFAAFFKFHAFFAKIKGWKFYLKIPTYIICGIPIYQAFMIPLITGKKLVKDGIDEDNPQKLRTGLIIFYTATCFNVCVVKYLYRKKKLGGSEDAIKSKGV